jgi:hypothetical protein
MVVVTESVQFGMQIRLYQRFLCTRKSSCISAGSLLASFGIVLHLHNSAMDAELQLRMSKKIAQLTKVGPCIPFGR